jgi:dTDP-4-amino-4,6-dideoxygalactose transaminase
VDGLTIPYSDAEVDSSSCYVMPLVLDDLELQAPLRELMRERWNVQTSLLYPSVSEFSAYRDAAGTLPKSERIARTQVTIPLFPHLEEADQDRVVASVREGLAELSRHGE